MSRSQLVAENLPLLRRYSRALTGSQASGDAYVGAMLEALLEDPSLLNEERGARAGLFRLFTQIWNSVSVNGDAAPTISSSEHRLANITPLPRQAFKISSRSTSPKRRSRSTSPSTRRLSRRRPRSAPTTGCSPPSAPTASRGSRRRRNRTPLAPRGGRAKPSAAPPRMATNNRTTSPEGIDHRVTGRGPVTAIRACRPR